MSINSLGLHDKINIIIEVQLNYDISITFTGSISFYCVDVVLFCNQDTKSSICSMFLQLQVLIEDSARLQQTYPGDNAAEIEQLQATVVENWGVLQDRAAERKEQLIAAADLHRLSADVSPELVHYP